MIECALSLSVSSSDFKYTLNDGFFISLDKDKISSILGTPRVTLDFEATPEK